MIFMLGGLWAACFSEEAYLVSIYTLICASAKYIFISNNSKEEVGTHFLFAFFVWLFSAKLV
jgi:hypothetical protein